MKKMVFAAAMMCLAAVAGEGKRPMALVVMWDGARADGIVNADLVNLRKLAFGKWQPGYNGAWSFCGKPIEDARAYSFANHASIMNGVTCAKHGVTFNHTSNRCRTEKWPCWLTRLMDAQPDKKTSFIYACPGANWKSCGDERVAHQNYGEDDPAKTEHMVKLYSSTNAPDAAVVFYGKPDSVGHYKMFYPMPREYREMLKSLDDQLGRILSAIAARPTFRDEDWLILFTADHGGYHFMHGWEDAHSRTTPFLLAGRHVVNGQIAGFPRGQDVAATMLAHFGVDTSKMDLDSVEVGKKLAAWGPAPKLEESLTWYYPMLAKNKYLVNAVEKGPGAVLFGDEEYFNPNRPDTLFKKSFCLWVGGDEDVPVGAHLEESLDMFLCPFPVFTLSFWAKTAKREGRQILFGNKDFARAGSPGFVVTSGLHTERTTNGMCLVFGTPEGKDRIVGTFDIEYGKWGFYAIVFTCEGQAWFCQGREDGSFHWVSARAEKALLGSGLPLSVGNDGTGAYKWNYMDRLADIAVWKRSLTLDELRCIFQAGRKGQQLKDIMQMDVKSPKAEEFLDTTEKAGIGL